MLLGAVVRVLGIRAHVDASPPELGPVSSQDYWKVSPMSFP